MIESVAPDAPEDEQVLVRRAAAAEGMSQAAWMRKTLHHASERFTPPAPRLPLLKSGKQRLAEQLDRALEGFGSA